MTPLEELDALHRLIARKPHIERAVKYLLDTDKLTAQEILECFAHETETDHETP